ncbi:protein kinase [Angomonas deanei]|uniref:Protein tyrosine kinase/Protein kinase domain/Fungal protein kinase, putative n=1 Tax=Angomonas deanei TaxID=59799 RepID=S9UMP2_9TRYP|nr:protein kinase [Angomonas deanei]EPY35039.1 protein kinase [Angomonas deanei]CAD2212670.1 Protein tyrosine kinase/Protein kinase domain/Fungal protein kinase, putative [Angomonas deanei]|eukprot:EPY30009.1 protein kinase [Angomonas deanei]
MEYCEGGSVDLVHKFLKKPLPEKLIAYVCREVLLGLQYLHKHRLIHRDIKGSNVLLTRDGQVKLADFGVSTQLENTWSRRNTFIGTVLWMAPEAIVEDEYSYKADIWSLGITVIEMAENGPPYPNATIPRLLTLIPKSDPPTLQHKEQWSPQMSLFIKRLLTKEKNARPSATEMLDDPFVATDGVGTREELQSVVEEVLEVRENMSSARVRRGEYSSDATTATFVERGTAGGKNLSSSNSNASPFTAETHQEMEPGFFSDGTVPQLPLLTCSDLSFDELVAGEERGKMSAGEVVAMLYGPAHEGVCSQEPAATLKTTETLQNVYAFNRVRPIEMGLTSKEGQETVRSRQKYGIFLRQIYKI